LLSSKEDGQRKEITGVRPLENLLFYFFLAILVQTINHDYSRLLFYRARARAQRVAIF